MRKIVITMLCVCMVGILSACEQVTEVTQDLEIETVQETLDDNTQTTDNTTEIIQYEEYEEKVIPDIIDLTDYSSTMLYAQVYYMQADPESYIGKTVILKGQFATFEDVENDKVYFGCLVMDETGCCMQGMDFVVEGDLIYPDDYPEIGDEITITGSFEVYEENGYKYCHLVNTIIS